MTALQPEVPAGCQLIVHDSIGSTNEEAKALAQQGAPAGTAVWAREQRAGRGRHGRSWTSPRGNLYLSVIQRPDCAPAAAPQLGFVAGVALAEAIAGLTGLAVALKWPNDVMIDGKKASGILLESAARADGTLAWVVIGSGVNVALSPSDLPGVTSLREAGADIAVEALLTAYLARLCQNAERWRAHGFAPIRARWLEFGPAGASEMRVRLPEGEVSGRFDGLDERGSLLLQTQSGSRRIDMGEVFPLPPASEGVG